MRDQSFMKLIIYYQTFLIQLKYINIIDTLATNVINNLQQPLNDNYETFTTAVYIIRHVLS